MFKVNKVGRAETCVTRMITFTIAVNLLHDYTTDGMSMGFENNETLRSY